MAIEILMPALSPTMEEGTLAKWLVAEGDKVSSGDILAEIETDKATMEFEAVDEGVIGKLLIAEGTANVAVNSAIAVLLDEGESLSDAASLPQQRPSGQRGSAGGPAPAASAQAPVAVQVVEPDLPAGTTFKSSPCARPFARPCPKRCALMKRSSSWVKRWPNIKAPIRSRRVCLMSLAQSG